MKACATSPGAVSRWASMHSKHSKPPTITAEQVKGFGLFTLKVFSGRGDEINDLAKINIVR
jgi:hypothetical protein